MSDTQALPSAATPPGATAAPAAAQTLQSAKTPVGPGSVAYVGIALAVLVTALGVVLVHDAVVASPVVAGRSWVSAPVDGVDGVTAAAWLVPVAVLLVLLGLWLLVSALRPRPRTAVALRATTGVFLRPKDVAALARRAAEEVDGVIDVTARATTSRVRVRVTATSAQAVDEPVRAAVTNRLAALAHPPRLDVTVKNERLGS